MGKQVLIFCFLFIILLFPAEGGGRDYLRHLVKNLYNIGYPLEKDDIIALDKIAMKFNSKNRLDVLIKILMNRDFIHDLKGADYFVRTEVICDALRLLDEHELPSVKAMITTLDGQEGWEKRERTLLAFMAARRDIRYEGNSAYLLQALREYCSDGDRPSDEQISQTIFDVCNCLSYLADLFYYKGDIIYLKALIEYGAKAYGYPAEYMSNMFIDILLKKPSVFIVVLATYPDDTVKVTINSLIFGRWNEEKTKKIEEILQNSPPLENHREKEVIHLLKDGIKDLSTASAVKPVAQSVGNPD